MSRDAGRDISLLTVAMIKNSSNYPGGVMLDSCVKGWKPFFVRSAVMSRWFKLSAPLLQLKLDWSQWGTKLTLILEECQQMQSLMSNTRKYTPGHDIIALVTASGIWKIKSDENTQMHVTPKKICKSHTFWSCSLQSFQPSLESQAMCWTNRSSRQ